MRRLQEVTKKAMAVLLSAALIASSTTVVYADGSNNNNLDSNNGTIEFNNGTVRNNYGIINYNKEPGTVVNNCSVGIITNNNSGLENGADTGRGVRYNSGTVTTNNGLVSENMAAETEEGFGGRIDTNNGTITVNNSGLGDNGNKDGVKTNYGTITTNNGYVKLNSDKNNPDKGKIIFNGGNGEAVVNSNYGEIRDNAGKVNYNIGKVGDNTGLIDSNKSSGTVSENNVGGTINGNYGNVTGNHGLIDANFSDVENNYGKITDNKDIKVQINDNGDINHLLGKVTNNYGEITSNEGIVSNNMIDNVIGTGSIAANNGVVTSNHGVIEINNIIYDDNGQVDFSIKTNESDGVIKLNNGAVEYSYGTIEINKNAGLDWVNNFGMITDNYGDVHNIGNPGQHIYGRIINQYEGEVVGENQRTVIENMLGGELHGEGIIVNYFNGELYDDHEIPGNIDGKIENNFTDTGTGTPDKIKNAENQFRSVSLDAAENSTVSYGDDFKKKTFPDSEGREGVTRYYINVTGNENGSGIITITADKGFEIVKSGEDRGTITGEAFSFNYSLVPDDSNYKISITGYQGNSCDLKMSDFGLSVSEAAVTETKVKTPVFTPDGGTYTSARNVTISSETSDADIYYTIDGSDPTATSGTPYSEPVSVTKTLTIKAIAVKPGMRDSDVSSATYTIKSDTPALVKYRVTVNCGTGDGEYEENATVTIKADDPAEGKVFDKWTSEDGVEFADAASPETTFRMPSHDVTVTATYKDKEQKKEDDPDPNKPEPDKTKVPVTDPSSSYASPEDNFAPVAPGASEGTGGNIKKLELDFSKVKASGVATDGLKMTAIAGSKFTTKAKVKDKDSVKTEGGVKAKFNKKDSTATITCKTDGKATFETEDGSYTVNFKVDKPKPNKNEAKLSAGTAPVTKTIKDLFGTTITGGKLEILKEKTSGQAAVKDNELTVNPAEKDTIKLQYQYLNKKYKMTMKVK